MQTGNQTEDEVWEDSEKDEKGRGRLERGGKARWKGQV